MKQITPRDRLRYRVDTLMSRGPAPVVIGLFVFTLAVALIVSLIIFVLGWGDFGDPNNGGQDFTFFDIIWRAILTTIDTGAVGNYTGTPVTMAFLLAMFGVTIIGIFFTSIFIGILVTAIQNRLEELRKGRSRVLESNQTVILGWSQQIFAIVSELSIANQNQRRSAIVILADRDKVEMEDALKGAGRQARPDPDHLPLRQPDRRDRPRDREHPDGASRSSSWRPKPTIPTPTSSRRSWPSPTAPTGAPSRTTSWPSCASRRTSTSPGWSAARRPQLVLGGDLIARIVAQTCRQSGLSVVYTELLDFEGDEIYFSPVPAALVGRPFCESLFAYDTPRSSACWPAAGAPAQPADGHACSRPATS